MKRIKAACIFQTLVFQQKPDCGFSREHILNMNRQEAERYKRELERKDIRHRIVSQEEQPDGSILLRIRKQYNDKADVAEYFA